MRFRASSTTPVAALFHHAVTPAVKKIGSIRPKCRTITEEVPRTFTEESKPRMVVMDFSAVRRRRHAGAG